MSEQLVRPLDFAGEQPPERIIGNETEYDARRPDGSTDNNWPEYLFEESTLAAVGLVAHVPPGGHYNWLSNGAMVYPDVGHLEYATPESRGPLEATATLHAGNLVLGRLMAQSGSETKLFRRSATVHPETGAIVTKGAHESYCIPLYVASAAQMAPLEPLFASRMYVGNGIVTRQGFNIAPKAYDIGSPITESIGNRCSLGAKPFAIVRTATNNNDSDTNLAEHGFGRLEARGGTPGSPWSDFMSMVTTSVGIRIIEHGETMPKELRRLQDLQLASSVKAFKTFSVFDPRFQQITRQADGRNVTFVDIQEAALEIGESVMKKLELPISEQLGIHEWRRIVDDMRRIQRGEANLDLIADRVGWAAKYTRLIRRLGERAVERGEIKALMYCLAWDRTAPQGGGQLYDQRYGYQLFGDGYLERYTTQAPPDTRANARSQYILAHGTSHSQLGNMRWPFVDLDRYDNHTRRVTLHPYDPKVPRLGRKDNRW